MTTNLHLVCQVMHDTCIVIKVLQTIIFVQVTLQTVSIHFITTDDREINKIGKPYCLTIANKSFLSDSRYCVVIRGIYHLVLPKSFKSFK